MNQTKLKYLEDFNLLETESKVVEVSKDGDRDVVILEETIFYPQGGGQPYDQGVIGSSSIKFLVEEVRFVDGQVKHIGKFEHRSFQIGDLVKCIVDRDRRKLNARIHSAGHLVDKAIFELKLNWIPGKGYHFPNGPYDEYTGKLEGLDREKIKSDIEVFCNKYVEKSGKTEVIFMTREKMKEVCHYAPDFPEAKGELARVVVHDGYYMPCGGTPVSNLAEVGRVTIRKIKQESDKVRVGYDVNR